MAYCTHDDVSGKTGIAYTETSQPTLERVKDLTTQISNEIDGVLRAAGYDLPITDATDLATLARYATLGSAYEAWHESIIADDNPARVDAWEKDYRDFLSRLRRGEQKLAGQDWPTEMRSISSMTVKRQDGYAARAQQGEYG